MISIVHPSARPERAWETLAAWHKAAAWSEAIETVLCFDWGEDWEPPNGWETFPPTRRVYNYERRCSVSATNTAAQCARGDILVVISDDTLPCKGWDEKLKGAFKYAIGPRVLAVDTQDQEDVTRTLTVQILNRARYEQIGYIFHPDYTSMYADDEFTEHAKRDGVLVEAMHIKMPHKRFEPDEVYARQQAPERFEWGATLLEIRRRAGFPRVTPGLEHGIRRPV